MYLSLVEHQKTSAVEIKEYFSKFGAMQKKNITFPTISKETDLNLNNMIFIYIPIYV